MRRFVYNAYRYFFQMNKFECKNVSEKNVILIFWFQTIMMRNVKCRHSWPAPCQVDSENNKNILCNDQKQSVRVYPKICVNLQSSV